MVSILCMTPSYVLRYILMSRVATLVNFRWGCGLYRCFYCAFILPSRSGIIPALIDNHRLQKLAFFSLSTKRERMPKKGKLTRGAQQDVDLPTSGGEEGISSAISLTKDGHTCVKIQAKPGAKQSNITDISADGVGIQIAAPAREGEANEELVRYLAEVLNVRKRSISLNKGSKSRQKVVTIESTEISVEQVREKLSHEASQD